jgi:CRP-like cAMP-binding protein
MNQATKSQPSIAESLRTVSFLRDLKDDQIASLARISRAVDFAAGTVIFGENEAATHGYLIVEGHVMVEICGPAHCHTVLTIGPGELLGWSALLGAPRLTATARAVEATRAIELAGSDVYDLCQRDPALGYQLMKGIAQTLSNRLTATRLQLLDLFGS